MLSEVLITLFTTGIKLSCKSQPHMTFPCGNRGDSNIFNQWRFHQQTLWQILCLPACTNKAVEVWESIIVQNKNMQLIHYTNIVNKMRIVCCNMLANRKKTNKKPCEGPCKVLQCVQDQPVVPYVVLWAWTWSGQTLLWAALQLLPPCHCCGARLGATRGTGSPQGENGAYKCALQWFYGGL